MIKGKKKKVPQSLFPNLFPIELSVLFLLKYSCSIEAKLWHPYSCWVSWYAEGTLCEQERARFWHFCCCCALCLQDSHKLDFLIFLLFFFFPKVGRFEVNLISPDTKSVVLEKNFKDISSCSQVSINKKQRIDYQKKMNWFVLLLGCLANI